MNEQDEKRLRVIVDPNMKNADFGRKIMVMDRTDLSIPPFNMDITYMDLKRKGWAMNDLYVDTSKDYAVIRSDDESFSYPTRFRIEKKSDGNDDADSANIMMN